MHDVNNPRTRAIQDYFWSADDKYGELKKALCVDIGAQYVVLPKRPPGISPISTTDIVRSIRAPDTVPLRVDFGGGWLDVPQYARQGASG
jgi:hypothetical protein